MRQLVIGALTITLLVTLSHSITSAESPEEIMEKRALGFVTTLQAGDSEALFVYMNENWAPAKPGDNRDGRWTRIAGDLVKRHAQVEIVGVTVDQPYLLSVQTTEENGPALSFIFEFEETPPYGIVQLGIEAGDRGPKADLPDFIMPPDASTDQIVEALNIWFGTLEKQDKFSGTALIAWQGKAIFTGAWGMADKRWDIPNNADTRFDLGSINKSFTKIAIGQLLLADKLTLDDPLSKHISDYPNAEVAGKVTIRHLLEHSSGLGDIFTEEFFNSSKSLYESPRDFFALFADAPLQFEPGESQSYSNAGFMVLGVIIENVSGQTYYEYVQQHVFDRAGMTGAGFFRRDDPVANVAEGYTQMRSEDEDGSWRSNAFMLPVRGNSAGSAQATVADLLAFDNALRTYKLLPPNYTAWYFGDDGALTQAKLMDMPERATVGTGIAGGAPGVSAALESDEDLAVIILSNYDAPIAESVSRALYRPLKKALGETM
ncbi:MAG: beta-lactamase family protein [candidate division Zixibacteria bacterium]|nr:beta-lactamase family protein [candidate division Zixibacteria bacterium]MDH3938966.1 beta-lactamase family protein [candidate division Zixibacteria bacterium]